MVHGNKFIIVLDNGDYIGCKDKEVLEFKLREAELFQIAIYNVYRRNKKGHFILYPFERKYGNVHFYPVSWLDSIIKQNDKKFDINPTDYSTGRELNESSD